MYKLTIHYDHIPGRENGVADTLSRAHLTGALQGKAQDIIESKGLRVVEGCYDMFDMVTQSLYSRSGVQLLSGKSRSYTAKSSIRRRTLVPVQHVLIAIKSIQKAG